MQNLSNFHRNHLRHTRISKVHWKEHIMLSKNRISCVLYDRVSVNGQTTYKKYNCTCLSSKWPMKTACPTGKSTSPRLPDLVLFEPCNHVQACILPTCVSYLEKLVSYLFSLTGALCTCSIPTGCSRAAWAEGVPEWSQCKVISKE